MTNMKQFLLPRIKKKSERSDRGGKYRLVFMLVVILPFLRISKFLIFSAGSLQDEVFPHIGIPFFFFSFIWYQSGFFSTPLPFSSGEIWPMAQERSLRSYLLFAVLLTEGWIRCGVLKIHVFGVYIGKRKKNTSTPGDEDMIFY